jgi:phosphoribosylaminoimidazole-succinocarboxamide synthase
VFCDNNNYNINLPFNLIHQGKVRNIYDLVDNYLIVASDRISAFDYVLPTLILNKGKVLHQLSMFWFNMTKSIIENHIVTGDFNTFPQNLKKYSYLCGRSMIVKKATRINIECIVRGYISGSGWSEYCKTGKICNIALDKNLKESSKLQYPIFTPSTKEETGQHDKNISFADMINILGQEVAYKLKNTSIELYNKISQYTLSKGLILADTKFEYGVYNNNIILIDEIFTPDSSRFWEIDKYQEGKSQDSLDKQYVRNYLEYIKWNKEPPIPKLPDSIVKQTIMKYIDVYEKLTGCKFNYV